MSEQANSQFQSDAGRRRVAFSLSIPAFISSILVLLVGIVWIFILGIIIGRGHSPESRIPELERLMPQPSAQSVPTPLRAEPSANKTEQRSSAPVASVTPVDPATPIAAEELGYRVALKADQPSAVARASSAKPQDKNTPKPAAKPAEKTPAKPAEKAVPKPAERAVPKPVDKPAEKPDEKSREDKKTDGAKEEVFDFRYQVATHKNAAQAEAMAAKLKGAGMKARVIQGKTGDTVWYRIVVGFRGTAQESKTLRSDLAKQNISSVILDSKTPVRQ